MVYIVCLQTKIEKLYLSEIMTLYADKQATY